MQYTTRIRPFGHMGLPAYSRTLVSESLRYLLCGSGCAGWLGHSLGTVIVYMFWNWCERLTRNILACVCLSGLNGWSELAWLKNE